MKDELLAHLHDIREAVFAIKTFIEGKSFGEYLEDDLLKSAVERKFEIVGEALNRIKKLNPDILERIRDHRDIISFRNILIHGYDSIDDRIVWGIMAEDLDRLLEDVNELFE